MNHSEDIKDLAAALAKAQGQMENAAKDSNNPHFKSKYADLASVWDACRKALSENGLSVVQPAGGGPETVTVTTRLMHTSGQWIEEAITLKPMQMTPQGIGSCITYGRRYALASMVGVCPDDDDGNAASQPVAPVQTQPRKPVQPAPKAEPVLPQVRQILALQMEHQLSNEQVLQIGGLETLRGSTEEQLIEALNRLDFHIKEVKQA